MKKIDKYIKRNKHECIWDLGLHILLSVGSISPSGIIPLLIAILLYFFNICYFFRGGWGGSGQEGLYCFGVCLFLFLLPGQ